MVRRVTSEPVVNLSVCSKESPITFLKTSLRRSRAKPCEATPPSAEEPTPQAPPMIISSIMSKPVWIISPISCPSTPSSTILDISFG